jgi:hypothetical protein
MQAQPDKSPYLSNTVISLLEMYGGETLNCEQEHNILSPSVGLRYDVYW